MSFGLRASLTMDSALQQVRPTCHSSCGSPPDTVFSNTWESAGNQRPSSGRLAAV